MAEGRVTTFSELESQHSRFYLSWQVWTGTLLYQTASWRLYQMFLWSDRDCFVLTWCHFVNMKGCQLRSWKLHHYLEVWCCLNWNKKQKRNNEQWRLQWLEIKPCVGKILLFTMGGDFWKFYNLIGSGINQCQSQEVGMSAKCWGYTSDKVDISLLVLVSQFNSILGVILVSLKPLLRGVWRGDLPGYSTWDLPC